MDIKNRQQYYQTLRRDFETGRLDKASFAAQLDKLGFQDGWGRYWSIGAQSGDWYWYDGQNWRRGDPDQAGRLPFMNAEGHYWQAGPADVFPPEINESTVSTQNGSAPVVSATPGRPQVAVSKMVGLMAGVLCAIILAWMILLPASSASPLTGPLPAPSPRPPLGGGGGGGSGGGDGGGSGGSTGSTGAIFGTVLDVSTGQPAAGMEVDVSGQIVRTDTDGSYSITGLPAGQYEVAPVLDGQGTLVQGPIYANVDGVNSITVDLNYASQSPPPRVEVIPAPPVITDQTAPPALPSSGADIHHRPLMLIGLGVVLLLLGGRLYKKRPGSELEIDEGD
jgi:hypothetical protein